jgi:hypothetical protein
MAISKTERNRRNAARMRVYAQTEAGRTAINQYQRNGTTKAVIAHRVDNTIWRINRVMQRVDAICLDYEDDRDWMIWLITGLRVRPYIGNTTGASGGWKPRNTGS